MKVLSEEIGKHIFSDYLRLIRGGKLPAIVPVISGTCGGCRMTIPPQSFNLLIAKPDDLHTCSHCNRIVYFRAPPAPAEEVPTEEVSTRKQTQSAKGIVARPGSSASCDVQTVCTFPTVSNSKRSTIRNEQRLPSLPCRVSDVLPGTTVHVARIGARATWLAPVHMPALRVTLRPMNPPGGLSRPGSRGRVHGRVRRRTWRLGRVAFRASPCL